MGKGIGDVHVINKGIKSYLFQNASYFKKLI